MTGADLHIVVDPRVEVSQRLLSVLLRGDGSAIAAFKTVGGERDSYPAPYGDVVASICSAHTAGLATDAVAISGMMDGHPMFKAIGSDHLRNLAYAFPAPLSSDEAQTLVLRDVLTLRAMPREGNGSRQALAVGLNDLLAKPFSTPRQLLPPWLIEGGLAMVHAWRGVGKTHFALGAALAVASGSKFMRWQAPSASKVLYVDGEMPGRAMAERVKASLTGCNDDWDRGNFRILTPDLLPHGACVPNLLTPEGQDAIEADLEACELVVFDNVATLFRTSEDQNSASTWLPVQDYILALRRRGKSVLLVDHDNKTGGNRGTSAKEDVLDCVIQLKQPTDYVSSDGARFEVHFKKHRHFYGRDATPFEAQLVVVGDRTEWTLKTAEDALADRFCELMALGATEKQMREELGVGGSKIAALKAAFQRRGEK